MCEKVNLKRSIPVVQATTCLRSAIRNFVALSFVLEWAKVQRLPQILGALGLDHVSPTQWIQFVEWIAPFSKGSPTGACKKQELMQFDVEISHHWISWQRWKKEHKHYNAPFNFYPSDRANGWRWAEGWNAYVPVIYLNETRPVVVNIFHTNERTSDNVRWEVKLVMSRWGKLKLKPHLVQAYFSLS